MKIFLCPGCSHSVEKLGSPGSIERNGQHCCAVCGRVLVQQDVNLDEAQRLKSRNSWYIFKWVFSFEVLWVLLAIVMSAVAAKVVR